jgi:hypothetical protein
MPATFCKKSFITQSYSLHPYSLLLVVPLLGQAEECVVKLMNSPDEPESKTSYKLDKGGWADV